MILTLMNPRRFLSVLVLTGCTLMLSGCLEGVSFFQPSPGYYSRPGYVYRSPSSVKNWAGSGFYDGAVYRQPSRKYYTQNSSYYRQNYPGRANWYKNRYHNPRGGPGWNNGNQRYYRANPGWYQ